jgi:BirA family biotin operon repressor/biotin-[acetyl-CoA-carboxylase] ligase
VTPQLDAWLDAVRQGVTLASTTADPFAHVHVLASTASTNDDVARAAAEGAPEGYAVIAAEQTAGRGRRGAAWHSPAAHGLYGSMLLRPPRWPSVLADAASPAPALATLMAGVAVAQAVRDVRGAAVELKWPNDVMVRDGASGWRKLAGILAEGASEGGVLRTIVLGVGVNVYRSPAPPGIATRMITLEELTPGPADDGGLARGLVAALLVRLRDGVMRLSRGALDEVRAEWIALAPSVQGTPVSWETPSGLCRGVARGIFDDGALRVASADGRVERVHGGDVTWTLDGVRA